MYHSLMFGTSIDTAKAKLDGVNTWEDWHLIPSSRPVIAQPSIAAKYIDIPGRDGSIDISDYLINQPVFGDRSGSIEFLVMNDSDYGLSLLRSKITTYLRGRKMKMVLEDDPKYYWEGRFNLSQWRSDPQWSRVTIDYRVGPYKHSITEQGTDDIIWDTFNFEEDYDTYLMLNNIPVSGTKLVKPVVSEMDYFQPKVKLISGSVTASFEGVTQALTTVGQEVSLGYSVIGTENVITLTGNGVVSIRFREDRL